jgi:hypothetical protein
LDNHCLSERMPTPERKRRDAVAWTKKESESETAKIIQWRLATEDASAKLAHLYPQLARWLGIGAAVAGDNR